MSTPAKQKNSNLSATTTPRRKNNKIEIGSPSTGASLDDNNAATYAGINTKNMEFGGPIGALALMVDKFFISLFYI